MISTFTKKTSKIKNKSKIRSIPPILMLVILLFILISINFVKNLRYDNELYNSKLQEKIYNSMMIKETRLKAYSRSINLNKGSSSNTCVYFIAEVLRINGENIDDSTCNTTQLLQIMKKDGWKKSKNYKKLKPGDICFTTDENLNKNGIPTHTYIFMGWAEEGKYDYAYICDNQAKDYSGRIYHLRNITKIDTIKGSTKEPFNFFMYKKKGIIR
ncbi:hypothetical protein K8O96_01370 [Clostridium sporogenes]|uniref:Bacteriophage peptidoglycan hydrolase family protein n=1 Tax=Clostridium botulinum TaxID=1491 RepID=A0A6M0SVW7_CLOBO|nr:hypothetical protein [Clostridium sporogenes]NFA59667.1 hypothetical protein [Clostridium botulinum]NFI73202.1 hypothetical protein [Clostridium sporogenes]NFL74019.1 hypothetical protein [Clostridium sporogenes]NFM24761.1 hypothetical protein [Clostridium sporogenes]NFP60614.1 hypothetical protein [Clostridium sporogenes]